MNQRKREMDWSAKDIEEEKADWKIIHCILYISVCVCVCVCVYVCDSWSWLDSVLATGMPAMIQHIACMFRGMTVAAH